MLFVRAVFVIIDADKQNLSAVSFECLRIMSAFDLLDCCVCRFLIFQL
jgi:hypothetical protein